MINGAIITVSSLVGYGISKALKTNPVITIVVTLLVTYAGVLYHDIKHSY